MLKRLKLTCNSHQAFGPGQTPLTNHNLKRIKKDSTMANWNEFWNSKKSSRTSATRLELTRLIYSTFYNLMVHKPLRSPSSTPLTKEAKKDDPNLRFTFRAKIKLIQARPLCSHIQIWTPMIVIYLHLGNGDVLQKPAMLTQLTFRVVRLKCLSPIPKTDSWIRVLVLSVQMSKTIWGK